MERVDRQINFLKTDIAELLTVSNTDAISNFLETKNTDRGILSCFSNRKEDLSEIFSSINSSDQNLIFINGFQGTGKTTLINTILASLEDTTLSFYYECSPITNLDDIILSLYRYLHKHCVKTSESARTDKGFTQQSIDEKLINYLKNLKRPILLVIDGIENIFKDKINTVDKELIAFINYLLDIQNCKVIISGRKIPPSLKTNNENPLSIRLGGLDEPDTMQILSAYNLNCSESTLYQLYEISRGYPENIHLFANAVKELKLDAFELIKNYTVSQDSFEEYIVKIIYDNVPDNCNTILNIIAVIRHSIDIMALKNLYLTENTEAIVEYLKKIRIITPNREYFYIKNIFKEHIYKNIPFAEKIKLHKFWHELYSEQIAKKIDDRLFPISRKLLHSEQYYHYITLTKLDKNFSLDNNQKIQYTSDTHLGSLYRIKEPELPVTNTQIIEQNINTKPVTKEVSKQDFVYDDSNLTIELTEEEKLLLNEETSSDSDEIIEVKEDNCIIFDDSIFENEENIPSITLNDLKQQYINSENINDITNMADTSFNIADKYYHSDNFDEASTHYDRAYQLYIGNNDIEKANLALLKLAGIYSENYKHELALLNYHKIIDSDKMNVSVKVYIEALMGMAEIYDYREELDIALKYYNEAYQKAQNTSDQEILAVLCFKLALVYDDMKNYDKALEFYKLNAETTEDSDINPNLSSSYANMALIYEELNNKISAIEYYIKSLEIDIKINSREDQYKTLSRLGNLYFESGNIDKAFDSFHRELAVAKALNDPYSIAMSFLDIGDLYFYLKNHEKAVKAFILARQTIGNTISTDSKEKIERRFRHVKAEITEAGFEAILKTLHKRA
jgi:tetratricopeptide (TPR) repeat protein